MQIFSYFAVYFIVWWMTLFAVLPFGLRTQAEAEEVVPAELLIPQPNHVRLFYSKDQQGLSHAGPKELLESSLRMRPDRILLQELRDGTAFYYVRNVNSAEVVRCL